MKSGCSFEQIHIAKYIQQSFCHSQQNKQSFKYASNFHSDHSQGQALVDPLLLPGVTRHICYPHVSVQGCSRKGWWTCHSYQWFKLWLAESNKCWGSQSYFQCFAASTFVAAMLAYNLCGTVFVVALSKGFHNCCKNCRSFQLACY